MVEKKIKKLNDLVAEQVSELKKNQKEYQQIQARLVELEGSIRLRTGIIKGYKDALALLKGDNANNIKDTYKPKQKNGEVDVLKG